MLGMALGGMLAAGGAQAQPREKICSTPPVQTLLPGGVGTFYPELKSRVATLGTGAERVQWMVASWMGPMNGRVIAMDCFGRVLADAELGYLKLMEPGPVLPEVGRTLRVQATTGTGTGYLEETFFVLALADGKVARLWEHPALVRDAGDPNTANEKRWAVKISADGKRIDVTGEQTELPWRNRKQTRKALPAEAFCWDGMAFTACK
jgi:hypothetical protein